MLGPSTVAKAKTELDLYTTTQRDSVLLVSGSDLTALSSSQKRACTANKEHSLTSDLFCAKPTLRANGAMAPPAAYQHNSYTTTQGEQGEQGERNSLNAAAYIKAQAAACKANKANSNTSQPLR